MKRFLLTLFSLVIVCSSFLAGKVYAANAIPAPGRIPCATGQSDPEFSSDRPYQASPCGDRPITYWCGNDVVINLGTITTPYCDRRSGQQTICPCKGAKCDHTGANAQTIDVDLTDVELPILGNTQLTKNSQSGDDTIDDGTKTSEYVAWYLGGTNDKAEYATDPTTAEGLSKIIDTSGPLKKLLPSIIQDADRINTIESATKAVTYTPDGSEDNSTPAPVTQPENHNQIVVCGESNIPLIGNILGIGTLKPVDCYTGNGGGAKQPHMRLKDWEGSLSVANLIGNSVVATAISGLKLIYPFVPAGTLEESLGNHWNLRKPPLPWDDDPYATPARPMTSLEYQKYYNEWRGKTCVIVPIINLLVCFDNILVPNKYADLYPYIPLANTVDKQSVHVINNTHLDHPHVPDDSFTCPGNICYIIKHSPVLYLAHSLEDFELTNLLKLTYKPGEASGSADTAAVTATTNPPDVENNTQCRIIPSRTNPGDDATFTNPESHIEVQVQYHVENIECTNIHWVEPNCDDDSRPICKKGGHWEADCSTTIYATVNTQLKGAFMDEIWNNTVAGSDSIFRRIYPKTGADAPVSCIADTPAVSPATYTLNSNSSNGLELVRVIEPDKSAVKSEDGKVANAQLYYPHYGGVLDYFLHGIQTALRPQGYGDPTPQNGTLCQTVLPVDCVAANVPDSAVPSKYLGSFKTNFIDLANRWSATCPGEANNMAAKCYNYVASQAQKAGVNPAFALTIWLNESGASNYCNSGPTTQDFGINLPAIYKNISEQLKAFLTMAKMKLCDGTPGFVEPMHGWLSRFQSSAGACNPNDSVATAYYQEVMSTTWTWVSGCPKNGKFGITWPTDMSCP